MVEARGVHKRYTSGAQEVCAVRGVELAVKRGEIIAVVGPSGAGKSTLLHLLGGLIRPTMGEVWVDELNLYELGDRERARVRNHKIGFVFQNYHLLPEFTALENVTLPGLMGGVLDARARAAELLAQVGLAARALHRPSELSGGEQQRVAVARALMNQPELVLCDEPTGNLDSATGAAIWALIREINEHRGTTFMVVTHEQDIADTADRVLHMKDGRIDEGLH